MESSLAGTGATSNGIGTECIGSAAAIVHSTLINICTWRRHAATRKARTASAQILGVATVNIGADTTRSAIHIRAKRHIGAGSIQSPTCVAISTGTRILTRNHFSVCFAARATRPAVHGLTFINIPTRRLDTAAFVSICTHTREAIGNSLAYVMRTSAAGSTIYVGAFVNIRAFGTVTDIAILTGTPKSPHLVLAPCIQMATAIVGEAFVDIKTDLTRSLVASVTLTGESTLHIIAGRVRITRRLLSGAFVDIDAHLITAFKARRTPTFKSAHHIGADLIETARRHLRSTLIDINAFTVQSDIPIGTIGRRVVRVTSVRKSMCTSLSSSSRTRHTSVAPAISPTRGLFVL